MKKLIKKHSSVKKILFITFDFPPSIGGNETYVYNLVSELSKRTNFKISVVSGKRKGVQLNEIGIRNVDVYRIDNFQEFCMGGADLNSFINELNETCVSIKPDLIHTNSVFPGLIGLVVNENIGAKFVFTNHNTPSLFSNKNKINKSETNSLVKNKNIFSLFEKFLFSSDKIDFTISVSKYFTAYMINNGMNKKRVKTIYPGIDIDFFDTSRYDRSISRKKYKISNKDFVICCPARVVPRKRIEDLIYAIKELKDPSVKVIITGFATKLRSTYHQRIEKLINNSNLTAQILLRGNKFSIEDMPELYGLSDIVVLPSGEEGLGISLLEAMSSKTLVCASNIPGVDEVIKDGISGFFFDKGDYVKLSSIVKDVKDEKINKKKILLNAYDNVVSRFNNENQIKKIIDVYNKLLLK